ncbi:unnamed protein product [Polarella glacialis]|uniref:JmjC domain-containing protein n=1 Tax=Polarella glacialis TaxID=89957 RepID=A0A813HJK4_POLGL|nr:unnamed protein product [Polarella glacialis]CAE8638153.1 unnamed protein product [Polarella glacialis]
MCDPMVSVGQVQHLPQGSGRERREVEFSEPREVCAEDPVTFICWTGREQTAQFPKPRAGVRRAYLVRGFLSHQESQAILDLSSTVSSRGVVDDRMPATASSSSSSMSSPSFVDIMQSGQYMEPSLVSVIRPLVDNRLLPYIRHRFCPGAVVCSAVVRRNYLAPSSREMHDGSPDIPAECEVSHLHYCSAVIALNADTCPQGEASSLVVQTSASVESQSVVPLTAGDLFVHQFDLPTGICAHASVRYDLVFHFKDSILASLTNITPWYDQLAAEGDADAQLNLAMHLEQGLANRVADPAASAKWYRAAAEQGHAEAQHRLGMLCCSNGASDAASEAVRWWHKAALQGHRRAQCRLAEMLMRGRGTERNEPEALKWMQKSAEQLDSEAIHMLVVALATGRGGAPDLQAALRWCRRGAELGISELQHRLGVHLLTGTGCPADTVLAAHWLRRAAKAGHTGAQCNLGVLLARGLAGPRDLTEAESWFQLAADAGDPAGQSNLRLLQDPGSDVQADEDSVRVEMDSSQRETLAALMSQLQDMREVAEHPLPETADELAAILDELSSAAGDRVPVQSGLGIPPVACVVHTEARGGSSTVSSAADLHPSTSEATQSGAGRPQVAQLGQERRQRRSVPRVSAEQTQKILQLLEDGQPFLASAAMPQLIGNRVLDFMPKLMAASGRDQVTYEVQGIESDLQTLNAPLATYIQETGQSCEGSAYLMASSEVLRKPVLSAFLATPSCCRPYYGGKQSETGEGSQDWSLPVSIRPSGDRCLMVGGQGAKTQLRRDPVVSASWNMLVLGRARWRLFPADATPPDICADSDGWGSAVSSADCFAKDDLKVAQRSGASGASSAKAWEAVQEMGEVLVIPPGWWHQSMFEDRCLAVLGQFLDDCQLPLASAEVSLWLSSTVNDECPGQTPKQDEDASHSAVLERLAEKVRQGLIPGRPELCCGLRSAWSQPSDPS